MAAHYTRSSFIDGAPEVFNASGSGSGLAFPQYPANRNAGRGRSTCDRPLAFLNFLSSANTEAAVRS